MISVAMNRVPVCRSNRAPRKAPSAGAQKRWVTEGDRWVTENFGDRAPRKALSAGAQKRWVTEGDRNSPRVLLGNLGKDTTGTPSAPLYRETPAEKSVTFGHPEVVR